MSNWKWCVQGANGKVIRGWYNDNGTWYYLNDEGIMQTGWIKDKDGRWYYIDSNGSMKTGWLKDKDKWYYLEPNSTGYKGEMYGNRTSVIDGKSYYFDGTGAWIEEDFLMSYKCVEFVGSWEGFYSKAYEDPYYPDNKKWWTIGYGTTYAVIPEAFPKGLDSTCTKEQALVWLRHEMETCAKAIKGNLDSKGIALKQNEFDSLISFAYNCGTSALFGSTLYKNICNGIRNKDIITSNFAMWCNANGQQSEGLYIRRTKEAAMFLNADYTGNL
ncbi:glycoside hydrolase family protein [Clostridium sp. ZS2]|uniref:lysozyme n=1 Tax=Clostridium sp. ZS2 TaxID=2949988 RepID=UPI002079D090|nr:glycoside hydrolase family protein [Clostridium sp. ZS2]